VSVIERVIEKRLTQREAARMLGLTSRRQVCRACIVTVGIDRSSSATRYRGEGALIAQIGEI
jgi:hypothetical protein